MGHREYFLIWQINSGLEKNTLLIHAPVGLIYSNQGARLCVTGSKHSIQGAALSLALGTST